MEALAPERPKPEDLEPGKRIEFVQGLRRRVIHDRTSVSDEELRYAIDLLRCDRAVGGGASKSAPKEVVKPASLDDF